MLALRQKGNEFEAVAPGVLLDLPPPEVAPQLPDALRGVSDADAAVVSASAIYAAEYLAEVTSEQERRVGIVENALQQSVNDTLVQLQERLERQHADQAKGRDMRIAIRTTNLEVESLTSELRRRRDGLHHQKVTSIRTPRVVGVAAVIPGPVPAVMELGRSGGDKTNIELAAMKVAMDHETAYGRAPADVSKTGVGYDVRSEGKGGDVRYIEVKGHATTGDIVLYYTEWQMAHRMASEFFIYEVNHALTRPELRIIQDPVGQGIEPTERVVEYHVQSAQLERLAALPNDLEIYGRRRGELDFPCAICRSDLLDHFNGSVELVSRLSQPGMPGLQRSGGYCRWSIGCRLERGYGRDPGLH